MKQAAQNLIQQAAGGDFHTAVGIFNQDMVQALPEDKLKATWQEIVRQVGPFDRILRIEEVENQQTPIIMVTCQFEKIPLGFRIVFDEDGRIGGLTTQMAPSETPYRPPAYVRESAFHEEDVIVGSGEWAVPGTLSMPAGSGPFPAVVLVHGSGAQDRDETLGPNKPFRDLAWGLASQGIAVLRYEKRTKAHGGKFTTEIKARLTVQEEVIDDALAGVRFVRQQPRIDPGRVYVLGHSLGGMLAPRIGQQDLSLAGLIIMSGITRTLEDTILDQYTYLYGLSGGITDAQKAELEQLREKVARVKDPALSDRVPAKDLPLAVPPVYWLDLRGYHPEEVAKLLGMRILVLQGGRDYQVTPDGDFLGWQRALAGKSGAVLKLYPSLSHLYISGEGPSTPQDYLSEGHVSAEVIGDIARWILIP
ncbi:MAG TPA: alpha/beta fold hydrolase [Anaerolineaceae bacterium]